VCDCDQSVHDLDDATAPAFALLDDLATNGEPAWHVIALHAEGDLLEQLAQRVVQSVPAATSDDNAELHTLRLELVQPVVQPWRDRAHDRFVQVDRIAGEHTELASNALVTAAVADSRRRIAH
jgi:hypothetical protein